MQYLQFLVISTKGEICPNVVASIIQANGAEFSCRRSDKKSSAQSLIDCHLDERKDLPIVVAGTTFSSGADLMISRNDAAISRRSRRVCVDLGATNTSSDQ